MANTRWQHARVASTGILAVYLLAASASSASAQTPTPTPAPPPKEPSAERTFAGLKFGAGLSFTYDTGEHDRVESASIDANGIVRVDKTSNGIARIMLEAHYFFSPYKVDPLTAKTANPKKEYANWGMGPFVAVQPGSDEIINSIGVGVMLGFRYSKSNNQSFNLGFGLSVDPNTKVLGQEFVDGQPAPVGPDGKPLPIRYVTREQAGFLMLASFSWR